MKLNIEYNVILYEYLYYLQFVIFQKLIYFYFMISQSFKTLFEHQFLIVNLTRTYTKYIYNENLFGTE